MARVVALICALTLAAGILPGQAGSPPSKDKGSKVKNPEATPPPPPPPSPPPDRDRPPSKPFHHEPPDFPDDSWDSAPFFEFTGPEAPVVQCCRGPEPDLVTVRGTGEMTWAPWDYELLPCDYGERMVDPADKGCRTVNDCMMLPVAWDCCGSLLFAGVSKRAARRYLLLNHRCRPVLKWCDCPPGDYRAEDFKTSQDPADIRLECRRGRCRTFLKGD
jgi:hypothetical protein